MSFQIENSVVVVNETISEDPHRWLVSLFAVIILLCLIIILATLVPVSSTQVHRLYEKNALVLLFVKPSVSWNGHIVAVKTHDDVWHGVELLHGAVELVKRRVGGEGDVEVVEEVSRESVEVSCWHDDVAGARVDDDLSGESVEIGVFDVFSNLEAVGAFGEVLFMGVSWLFVILVGCLCTEI